MSACIIYTNQEMFSAVGFRAACIVSCSVWQQKKKKNKERKKKEKKRCLSAALPSYSCTQLPIRSSSLTDKGEGVTQHGIPNKRRRRGGMSAGYSRVLKEAQWPTNERLGEKINSGEASASRLVCISVTCG